MRPASFLIGQLPNGDRRWASIDPNARFTGAAVGETRFGGYLRPFPTEDAARQALEAAGAVSIDGEPERKRRGR
jgi:hypothetical protein